MITRISNRSQFGLTVACFIFLGLENLIGCGTSSGVPGTIDPATTKCSSGNAALSIGDGFLQVLCGCAGPNESSGKTFSAPGNLTCHLPAGNNTIYFYFLGTTLKHQIIPTGQNQFIASPISDPNQDNPMKSFVITFPRPSADQSSPLTYSFEDAFSHMSGQIFVP